VLGPRCEQSTGNFLSNDILSYSILEKSYIDYRVLRSIKGSGSGPVFLKVRLDFVFEMSICSTKKTMLIRTIRIST